jgi:hypothetical protein
VRGEDDSNSERRMVSVGDIPCPLVESVVVPDHERTEPENGGTQAQGSQRCTREEESRMRKQCLQSHLCQLCQVPCPCLL